MRYNALIQHLLQLTPSTMNSKHYSVLFSKGRIYYTGVNMPGIHAELNALNKSRCLLSG